MREKKVLIISYYFPPLGMGGVQRITKFVKYLPESGWKPYVLTVKDVEYIAKDRSLLNDLTDQARITRTGSFDPLRIQFLLKNILGSRDEEVARESLKKSGLLSWLFFPDNKVGWIPFALKKGLSVCRREKIDLIFSTSPPPSAHLTAYLIKRATKIPWIADFRDPWIGYKLERYPTQLHLLLKKRLEKTIITNADKVVAANPIIKGELEKTNPRKENLCLIDQGYDEEDFENFRPVAPEKFTIGYLGTFSQDCNPEPFFCALGELISENLVPKKKIGLKHVGGSLQIDMRKMAQKYGLQEILETKGYISHKDALNQMENVSVLLLVTSDDPCVFPAKVFEYLRLGKPILGIVPQDSEMAKLLREMKAQAIVPPENGEGIKQAILASFKDFERKEKSYPLEEKILKRFERKELTSRLASLFEEVISRRC
jgi:glycosyltransferase involved in cell wall biosynthesis